ncbi:MAG: ATP-binding protein, partial [Polyangiaceae bacterium]|nr:ATP-binding protein [Polyangiaceae bacterium]
GQLHSFGDSVQADEIESKVKSARQDAIRGMRDKLDLFSEGEGLVRFGRHRFSVNEQPLELTMIPRDGAMYLHITGTGFYERVEDPALSSARELWDQRLVSESEAVYRAEYLAATILFDAEGSKGALTIAALHDAERSDEGLLGIVRAYANERYDEGYERGVHDADAAAILGRLLTLRDSAGLLRFPSELRSIASWFWADLEDSDRRARIARNAQSLGRLQRAFGDTPSVQGFADELAGMLGAFAERNGIACTEAEAKLGGRYLAEELAAERPTFVTSADAERLREHLFVQLELAGTRRAFEDDLRALEADPRARYALVAAWIDAAVRREPTLAHATREATVLILTERKLSRVVSQAMTTAEVTGLLGQHGRIANRSMTLRLDEFLVRLAEFVFRGVPAFRAYRAARHAVLERERERLRLDELKPKPMTSFVRNRLIDEVYLPLVGANLAKQIGAAGDGKRTDLMGMLLLVSPPGYGKTTLMEYIASRLGLVFVKVNGPAIGHAVTSLDPAEAQSATARQEVEKIGLALEMGNNVMLYLDDIQHTSPELLQKFISLCDAQRRIEGVWKGRTRTYDLRGKKFCVVMAGNPYTETGEKFRIPDMLANRADTYNLGEILDGKRDAFELSYLENSLISCPALAPLAMRDPADVARVLRMANGEQIPSTDLSYAYSAAELSEMVAVVQRLFRVRDVLLKVNAAYIASASQEDAYRTEPPFKLQGSYRNMSKLAEKVVAVMNDEEVERLVDDHYQSESQTLTTGAEQNLLKLAELRGRLDAATSARWTEIKREYVRRRTMGGGGDADPVTRVTGSLAVLGRELEGIRDALTSAGSDTAPSKTLDGSIASLVAAMRALMPPNMSETVEPPAGYAEMLAHQVELVEQTLVPMARSATRTLDDARALHEHMIGLLDLLQHADARLRKAAGVA